jgi:hypothetical protein
MIIDPGHQIDLKPARRLHEGMALVIGVTLEEPSLRQALQEQGLKGAGGVARLSQPLHEDQL